MNLPPEPLTKGDRFLRLENEKNDMTVMEMYERHRNKIPFLIVITIGNYAETDLETFGGDQVFRIGGVSHQKRLIARDIQGRYLTIPVKYHLKFKVVKGRNNVGPAQTLEEIIEQNELPCIVQFSQKAKAEFKIGADKISAFNFGNIALTELYEEKYFLGISVDSAGILLDRVILIPLFLKEIMVARITGLVDGNEKDFENFQIGLTKAAEKVKHDYTAGNADIALLPEDCAMLTSENVYDYIDSKYFVDVKRKQSDTKSPTSPTSGHNYQSLDSSNTLKPALPPRGDSLKLNKKSDTSSKLPTSPTKPKIQRDSEIDEAFFSGGSIFQGTRADEMSISGGSIGSGPFVNDYVHDFCISDISDSLKKLKLNKYIEPLREAQIDGQFLLSLDEDSLKEDFGMKKFEAVKLMLFARTGHVPK